MSMKRRLLSVVVCGVLCCGLPTSSRIVPAAQAQSMEDIELARKLVDEAKAPFRRAADTELDYGERKKARKEAYTRLKKARNLYIAYLDAHPSEEDSFDGEFSKMAMMLHFIKKHAGIWEFSPRRTWDPKPKDPATGADGGTDSGGSGKDPEAGGDPPKPEADPPKPKEPGDDAAGPSEKPPGPTPAELAAAEHARILEYRKAHPGDIAGLHDLCLRFLADHEDPHLPAYEKVALLSGSLAEKLNSFYKAQTNQDPDAIDGGDSKDLKRVVARLSSILRKGEGDEKLQAIRLLGETRSGAASFSLVSLLKSDEADLVSAAKAALIQIGGQRTADNVIAAFRNSRKEEAQMSGLGVLIDIARKSNVDARGAVVPIGRFVMSKNQNVAGHALDYLGSLGAIGGLIAVALVVCWFRIRKLDGVG